MKKVISGAIDAKLYDWVDDYIKKSNGMIRNRSHLMEIALLKLSIEEE